MFSTFSKLKQDQKARAFDSLVRPHIEHLYRMAYYLTGTQHAAEDLVQELLTKLFSKTNKLEQIEKLRPWLSTALTNLFIDSKRRVNRSPVSYTDSTEAIEEENFDPHDCPELILQQEQEIDLLQNAFNQLIDEHRALLVLHDIEGYSLPELAESLSTPLGTLKSRLFRARNRLQLILENMKNEEPFDIANRVNE